MPDLTIVLVFVKCSDPGQWPFKKSYYGITAIVVILIELTHHETCK